MLGLSEFTQCSYNTILNTASGWQFGLAIKMPTGMPMFHIRVAGFELSHHSRFQLLRNVYPERQYMIVQMVRPLCHPCERHQLTFRVLGEWTTAWNLSVSLSLSFIHSPLSLHFWSVSLLMAGERRKMVRVLGVLMKILRTRLYWSSWLLLALPPLPWPFREWTNRWKISLSMVGVEF